MFKQLATAAALVAVTATGALAHHSTTFYKNAKVIDVQVMYDTKTVRVPETVCRDVTSTTHNGGQGNAGDALAGAIIGGIIGKGATKKDSGAAAGAIIGAIIANENSKKGGTSTTTTRRVCEEVYVERQERVALKYRFAVRIDGVRVWLDSTTPVSVGQLVEVKINVSN